SQFKCYLRREGHDLKQMQIQVLDHMVRIFPDTTHFVTVSETHALCAGASAGASASVLVLSRQQIHEFRKEEVRTQLVWSNETQMCSKLLELLIPFWKT